MPKNSNFLRVTSGIYRGTKLLSPDFGGTHPMGSREKLALFNMVTVDDAKVLDAYAGTGALGIEALSRGAKEVVFVESSPKAAQLIRRNLKNTLKTPENPVFPIKTTVFAEKVSKFAQNSAFEGYFSVIFADPPYDSWNEEELLELPVLLQKGGILALSLPKTATPPDLPGLEQKSSRIYANAQIIIYQKYSS